MHSILHLAAAMLVMLAAITAVQAAPAVSEMLDAGESVSADFKLLVPGVSDDLLSGASSGFSADLMTQAASAAFTGFVVPTASDFAVPVASGLVPSASAPAIPSAEASATGGTKLALVYNHPEVPDSYEAAMEAAQGVGARGVNATNPLNVTPTDEEMLVVEALRSLDVPPEYVGNPTLMYPLLNMIDITPALFDNKTALAEKIYALDAAGVFRTLINHSANNVTANDVNIADAVVAAGISDVGVVGVIPAFVPAVTADKRAVDNDANGPVEVGDDAIIAAKEYGCGGCCSCCANHGGYYQNGVCVGGGFDVDTGIAIGVGVGGAALAVGATVAVGAVVAVGVGAAVALGVGLLALLFLC